MSQSKRQSHAVSRAEEVRLPEMGSDSRKTSKLQSIQH